jgi:SAM-dependent methyltransferase
MNVEASAVADNDLTAYRQRPVERQRVDDLLAMVPPGVRTVLDIGARDGHLSRLLANRGLQVTALDLEAPRIDDERIRCVAGDATALTYADGEFDLVLCAEVLEHIPSAVLARACGELQRVAAGWLVVGVPYRQDIRFGRTTCRQCGGGNPPWGHVNRFDERRLAELFGACRLQAQSLIGQAEMGTNALAAALMDAAGNPYGTYSQDEPCIHCGATLARPARRTLLQRVLTRVGTWARRAQVPFHRPHANWIHQLLAKTAA